MSEETAISEEKEYWEKTWNLPFLSEPITCPDHPAWESDTREYVEKIIHKLLKENPDRALEILQHAMQIEGLCFYKSGQETGAYLPIMCHAACCDDKALEFMVNQLENTDFDLHIDIVNHGSVNDGYYSGDGKDAPKYLKWWKNRSKPYISGDKDIRDIPDVSSVLLKAMDDEKLIPSRLFEIYRKYSRFIDNPEYEACLNKTYEPEPSIRSGTLGASLVANGEKTIQKLMTCCVVKDPKLWDKYFAHVNATMKMNVFVGEISNLIKCCNEVSLNNTNLPRSFCSDVVDIASKVNWDYRKGLKPVLEHIAIEDLSYFYKNRDLYDSEFTQQVAIKDHSIIPSLKSISRENFDAFAKIYEEEYASRDNVHENLVGQKNVALDDGKKETEIMNTIKDKISQSDYYGHTPKPVQVWLVKNAKKYPNLVGEILKEKELPYVEMCIKNIENPEKENIACVLNRLKGKAGEGYEDFQERCEEKGIEYSWSEFEEKQIKSMTLTDVQDAVNFARRQEICWHACNAFAKDIQNEVEDVALSSTPIPMLFGARTGSSRVDTRLTYDMAEAGIDDFKTAKRVAKLFYALNERPAVYGSDYNAYYPSQLLPIAKSDVMQDWMYPVMLDAIQQGGLTISEGRIPSERTLFDCCKAWKINPAMPQRLAKFVGTHSLRGRMLAGAIFDKMCEEGKTTPEEWRDNKVLHEKFYEELDRAEKMPTQKAFKQYIPNTPINRKRVIGMGIEEKGIENTPENFKALYKQAREQGIFDKMLAKPEEARTTFSSRLLVETARRKRQR